MQREDNDPIPKVNPECKKEVDYFKKMLLTDVVQLINDKSTSFSMYAAVNLLQIWLSEIKRKDPSNENLNSVIDSVTTTVSERFDDPGIVARGEWKEDEIDGSESLTPYSL